jgi:hypothetical protein
MAYSSRFCEADKKKTGRPVFLCPLKLRSVIAGARPAARAALFAMAVGFGIWTIDHKAGAALRIIDKVNIGSQQILNRNLIHSLDAVRSNVVSMSRILLSSAMPVGAAASTRNVNAQSIPFKLFHS